MDAIFMFIKKGEKKYNLLRTDVVYKVTTWKLNEEAPQKRLITIVRNSILYFNKHDNFKFKFNRS
jgi:hypothetical protein